MKYKAIIFDVDHTLVDFRLDERRAFRTVLDLVGKSSEDKLDYLGHYSVLNWQSLGLDDVEREEIQNAYHELDFLHFAEVMDEVDRKYGLGEYRSVAEETYVEALSREGHLIGNALSVVKSLYGKAKLCVATNGLSVMQRARLRAFEPCFSELFISEEMGTIKPRKDFFEQILAKLQLRASECLMVGDSLRSDVAGAKNVGMDAVWFNRFGAPVPYDADFPVIERIDDLLKIIE